MDYKIMDYEKLCSLGLESLEKERFEEAMEYYVRATELDSNRPEAYFGRGTVKFDSGRYKESIEDFDRALP